MDSLVAIKRCPFPMQVLGLLLAAVLGFVSLAPGTVLAKDAPTSNWVMLDGQRVIEIKVAAGAQNPAELARRLSLALKRLANDNTRSADQLVVVEQPPYWMVAEQQADGRIVPGLAVDERAAQRFGISQQELAEQYRDRLRAAVQQYRSRRNPEAWLRGTLLALLVLGAYVLWLIVQRRLIQRLRLRLHNHAPGLQIGTIRLMDPDQLRPVLLWCVTLLNWTLLLLISYLLIPLLLGFFPPTQVLAAGLRGQILAVVRGLGRAVFQAIPSLLAIAVILSFTALSVRASNSWFRALDHGRVRLPGFYPEWGRPTGRIAAVLIVMAGLVVAYPYVPGAGSRTFQGAGLFVGLLAALGSSAVATNVISGVMLIYTRGFREGDRVEINGVVGTVQDRAMLVTRIRTPRNEVVSIPNATVIGASIVNYSLASREINQPVAIATTITIGYDVPWRHVHALLLDAAKAVAGIAAEPAPFVLQTSLNDFHISYELNASVQDTRRYRETLSDLLGSIQDQFAAADVEILSPGYHAIRNGNRSTVPQAHS